MKPQPALNWLVPITGLFTMLAAAAGLFWPESGQPFAFISLRGETVQMYGQGLYRYDLLMKGATLRGSDAVMLLAGIPLLVVAFILYRQGKLRGLLLLVGALTYTLYNAASLSFGAAYNPLLLALHRPARPQPVCLYPGVYRRRPASPGGSRAAGHAVPRPGGFYARFGRNPAAGVGIGHTRGTVFRAATPHPGELHHGGDVRAGPGRDHAGADRDGGIAAPPQAGVAGDVGIAAGPVRADRAGRHRADRSSSAWWASPSTPGR